jgi:hypothetical protein
MPRSRRAAAGPARAGRRLPRHLAGILAARPSCSSRPWPSLAVVVLWRGDVVRVATTVRSDLQTVMAFVVLWSQPDPSVCACSSSIGFHACSRLPSSRRTRHPCSTPTLPARSRLQSKVVVPCVVKKSQASGEDEANRVIFTKCSTEGLSKNQQRLLKILVESVTVL